MATINATKAMPSVAEETPERRHCLRVKRSRTEFRADQIAISDTSRCAQLFAHLEAHPDQCIIPFVPIQAFMSITEVIAW
jgi:hypothetical protein